MRNLTDPANDARLAKALHTGIQSGFGYDVPMYRVEAIIASSLHVDEPTLSARIGVALRENFAARDDQNFQKAKVALATMDELLTSKNAS